MRRPKEPINPEAEAAAMRVLAKTFFGIHHVDYWRNRVACGDKGVSVTLPSVCGGLSTYDSNYLTRLVVFAHDEKCRLRIDAGGGPRQLRAHIFLRAEHPSIEDATVAIRAKL